MLLTLQRTMRGDRYTMGTLAINGEPFCATLEPTDRHLTAETITPESKVNGRTAIPTGRYPVSVTYSPRFDCQLPLVQSVPCFEGIRNLLQHPVRWHPLRVKASATAARPNRMYRFVHHKKHN